LRKQEAAWQSTIDQDREGESRAMPGPEAPAVGWGSVKSLVRALTRERVVASAAPALLRENKPTGSPCELRLRQSADPHAIRVLRGRCQGDDLGDHLASRRACLAEFLSVATALV
jgi:hypothetical protein